MCRQPVAVNGTAWLPDCPYAWTNRPNGSIARLAIDTAARTVVVRHMERVYCIPPATGLPWNELNLYRFVIKNPIGYRFAKHL